MAQPSSDDFGLGPKQFFPPLEAYEANPRVRALAAAAARLQAVATQQPGNGSELPRQFFPTLDKAYESSPRLQALAADVARLQAVAAEMAPIVTEQIATLRRLGPIRVGLAPPFVPLRSRPRPLARSRLRRGRPCGRRQRHVARSTSSSDPGDPEPPELDLWQDPRFGSCNAAMLRVLLEVA